MLPAAPLQYFRLSLMYLGISLRGIRPQSWFPVRPKAGPDTRLTARPRADTAVRALWQLAVILCEFLSSKSGAEVQKLAKPEVSCEQPRGSHTGNENLVSTQNRLVLPPDGIGCNVPGTRHGLALLPWGEEQFAVPSYVPACGQDTLLQFCYEGPAALQTFVVGLPYIGRVTASGACLKLGCCCCCCCSCSHSGRQYRRSRRAMPLVRLPSSRRSPHSTCPRAGTRGHPLAQL